MSDRFVYKQKMLSMIDLCPNYVQFDSYRTTADSVVVDQASINIINVPPKAEPIVFKLNIKIPFIELHSFATYEPLDKSGPCFVLEPISGQSLKLRKYLNLDHDIQGLSEESTETTETTERSIVLKFKHKINNKVIETVEEWSKSANPVIQFYRRVSECESREQSSVESSSPSANSGQRVELFYKPLDLMFGTFECKANQLIFTLSLIKILYIKNERKSDFKPKLLIPLNAIKSLSFNINDKMVSLFIQFNDDFKTLAIDSYLNEGDSRLKFKFDPKSEDLRESYITIRFEDRMPSILVSYLKEISNHFGFNNKLKEFSNQKTIQLFESIKNQIQLISDSMKVRETELKYQSLKRSYDEMNDIFCGICLKKRNEVLAVDHKIVSTICGHIFCRECLEEALTIRDICPMCARCLRYELKFIEIFIK